MPQHLHKLGLPEWLFGQPAHLFSPVSWVRNKILLSLSHYIFGSLFTIAVNFSWLCVHVCLVTQSCLTLCSPMDYSLPCSSVHGISQARQPEWVAIFLLWGIFLTQGSNPCLLSLLHWQGDSLPLAPPGKPYANYNLYFFYTYIHNIYFNQGYEFCWHRASTPFSNLVYLLTLMHPFLLRSEVLLIVQ